MLLLAAAAFLSVAQDAVPTPATFDKLSTMIRPQAGESRFWDVPWLLSLGEARRKAAAEGKPILVWSGCGGVPITVTSAGGTMGRAPEVWTAGAVQLLKDRYVALTIDGVEESRRQDGVGEFLRNADCVVKTSNTAFAVVTASGKKVSYQGSPGPGSDFERFLRGSLRNFDDLPEAERKPAAVSVTEDPRSVPPGCLVVRVFNRNLAWDDRGELRYIVAEDYQIGGKRSEARYREVAHDFLWVPEAEAKALVAPAAKKGESYPAPVNFCLRLFRYHLQPSRGFGGEGNFAGAPADCGKITLTPEEISADGVLLRLDGSARLRQREGTDAALTYDPTLLGYLQFDRRKGTFTRFDVVALGAACGKVQHGGAGQRPGPYPLGIAFQLVPDPTPTDRVPPHPARRRLKQYLEIGSAPSR